MIECTEPFLANSEAVETDYITVTREEYDELITARAERDALVTAIRADVLPATLRRIIRQTETPYKVGSYVGEFFKSLSQGYNDSQRPERIYEDQDHRVKGTAR